LFYDWRLALSMGQTTKHSYPCERGRFDAPCPRDLTSGGTVSSGLYLFYLGVQRQILSTYSRSVFSVTGD